MESNTKPYNRQYFENIFSKEISNSQRNQNRLRLILEQRRGGRLLEVGFGKGELLRQASSYFDVEGIDVSEHAIKTSRRWAGKRIRCENISHSVLPRNTYHVIASFNILEHIPEPEPVVEKLCGALKPGGVLVGSVPYNAAALGRIHTVLANLFDKTHCSTFPPQRWHDIFVRAGFARVRFFGELMFGKNHCHYLDHLYWEYLSYNLMFVCSRE